MIRQILISAWLLLCTSLAFGQSLSVSAPFTSQTARANFRACYPGSDPAAVEGLSRVSNYGYAIEDIDGCPPPGIPGFECRPGTTWFRSDRFIDVDANALSEASARALALSFKRDGCSFSSVSNFHYAVTNRTVQSGFHYTYTKRACWGGFKTNKYRVSADILATVSLDDTLTTKPSVAVYNKKGNVLGIISVSALESVFQPILSTFDVVLGLALEEIVNNIKETDTPAQLPETPSVDAAEFGESSRLFDIIGSTNYEHLTDIDRSGFLSLPNGDLVIRIVQTSYAQRYAKGEFLGFRGLELDFLRSLGEVAPSEHVVAKGDTVWDLTEERFGDGRLFDYVASLNALDNPDELREGDILRLPHWQDLCRDLGGNPDAFVNDGENLWTKAVAGQVPFDTDLISTRSGDPDLILPYEVLAISP